MLAVSAIMMPAETNGLNQLPKRLYPHGTAVMSTLQPVAGAIGVSVFISIMNARQLKFLQQANTSKSPDALFEKLWWLVLNLSISLRLGCQLWQ